MAVKLRRIGLAFALVVAVLILFVQTPWGALATADVLCAWLIPNEVRIGGVRGNWITSLELRNFMFFNRDGSLLIAADTLRVRHRLFALLSGSYHAVDAAAINPVFRVPTAGASDDPAPAQDRGMSTRIERVQIANGRIELPDSTIVSAVHLAGSVQVDSGFVVQLREAIATVDLPGIGDALFVEARGVVADDRIEMDTLGISGTASRIGGIGHIAWEGRHYSSDFRIEAAPAVWTELVPSASITDTARFDLHLTGSGKALRLLAAGSLLGGHIDLDMEGIPRLDGPVSITIREARLEGLRLADKGTHFSGVMAGHMTGPSLEESYGSLSVTSSAAKVAGHALAPTRLDADLTDGKVIVQIASGIWKSTLNANGWVRPFDKLPAYAVEGHFDGLDIGSVAASHQSVVNGIYSVSGIGKETKASVTLSPSTINNLPVRRASVDAVLDGLYATVGLQLEAGEGEITIKGNAFVGDTLRFELEQGSWSALDIAALAGLETKGRSNGDATFSGSMSATGIAGQGTLAAWDSYVGEVDMERLDSRVYVSPSAARIDYISVLEGRRVEGSFSVSLLDVKSLNWRSRTRFENLDAAAFGIDMHSNLSGELSASGLGEQIRWMDMGIADSRINEQPVDSAWIAVAYGNGLWHINAEVDMPESHVRLEGDAYPDSVMVRSLEFRGLDIGKVLGTDDIETRLNGAVTASGVFVGDTLQAAGELRFDPSVLMQQRIAAGSAAVEYAGGHLQAFAHIDLPQGSITLDTLSVQAAKGLPTWRIRASAGGADLSGVGLPEGSLNVGLDLVGEGMKTDELTLHQGYVELDGSVLGDLVLSKMNADIRWEDGVLVVDTLETRSNALRLAGSGGIVLRGARESVFTVQGAVLDAGPVAALVGVEGILSGHAVGDTLWLNARSDSSGIFIAGRLNQTGGQFDDVRWLDLDADLTARWSRGSAPQGRFNAEVSRLSVPAVSAQSTSLDLTLRSDTLSFAGSVTVDSRRSGRVSGIVDLQREKVLVDRVSMNLDSDRWRLDQEATISLANGVRIRNLLLTSDDQEIALDGVLDLEGQQNLGLTIYDFRLGSVADLVGYEGLDGVLNGSVRMRGFAEYPEIHGNLNLSLESLGSMEGVATYADGQVEVHASITDLSAGSLSLQGRVPADLRLRKQTPLAASSAVTIAAEADDFDMRWVAPWLDDTVIARIGGTLSGAVGIAGTSNAPQLSGAARFEGGEAYLPLIGITVEEVAADIQFHGATAFVKHFSAVSGGTMEGSGTLSMDSLALGEFAVGMVLDRFLATDTPEGRSLVTGDIQLRGTTSAPVVTGTVRLTATDLRPMRADSDAALGLVALTEADLKMLERHFNIRATEADTTTFDLYEAMAMDLDVIIGDDVWLRARQNPEMHVLLTGVLKLAKEPYQEPQIQGTVQAVPVRSYIRQFGRRFDIQTGRVTFVGPATDPLLDFRASYEVTKRGGQRDAVTIFMDVDGSLHGPDGLELELSSAPVSLDQADIISYIATGLPAADAFQLAGTGTLQVGGDLARQQLAQLIAAAAGAGLGLDIVEIQMEGSRGATITAGKYVSRRLFASVSLPMTASENSGVVDSKSNRELTIEYSIFAWLLARLNSNPSTMGISLLYQYVY